MLEQVIDALYKSRGFHWVALYLSGGDEMLRQCFRGPLAAHSFAVGTGNEGPTIVPIRIATRVLGMLEVQAGRDGNVSPQDHAMFEQIAAMAARYLTTNQGKLLLRKAREKSQKPPAKTPQSVRQENRRAAAGERNAP